MRDCRSRLGEYVSKHGPGRPAWRWEVRMAKRRRKRKPQGLSPAPRIEPNAGGIDIGATEIYIAVPPDRDAQPVRRFI